MAGIPSGNEMLSFIDASMDPDGLRVLEHVAEERLSAVRAGRSIHERPAVIVASAVAAAPASPQGRNANERHAIATENKAAETKTANAREPMTP